MKQKKTENYYQLNSIILPVIMLILLGLGLFAAIRLTGLQQILKSKASSEKATIELGTSKTVTPEEAFEIPVMLSLKGQQIVAADVVLIFDKSILELKDITAKSDSSNNKLTTYLPRDSNGFNKNKVLQLANSTGRIEFGAVCFTASGCPENQTQDLGIANPLAILKFKTLKTGNTTLSILYSPNDKKNSNLITRAKEQVIGNSTPLNITAAALVAAPSPTPVIAPLTTTLTLSKTSGFVNGETITLNFTAQGGAGTKTIYTSVWEGITDPSQKTGEGNYQGFSGNTGQRTARVPFYVEYLATDNQNNRENAKTMLVTPAPAPVSVNLLNPSFENWSNGVGSGTVDRATPDGWVMIPNDGYSRRETNTHNGSYSWMRVAYGNGGEYMGGYQDITVNPNTNYTISVWALEPGAPLNWYRSSAGGNIDVRNRICAKTTSNQDIKCLDSTEASENWQKLELSFNSGSNNTIRVYFGTNISQTTFWDDFSISQQ